MGKMMMLVLVFLFYESVFAVSGQKQGFIVTAPNTLLVDSVENICISLHNQAGPVQVTITLRGSFSNQLLVSASHTVIAAGCLPLTVPATEEREGRLVVGVQSAFSEQSVKFQQDPLVTLVSTDKPLYKPGQDVNFRVLSLTHKLKPHNGKVKNVWIETPTGIRVQQWRDVEITNQGLIQFQFSLDSDPLLGQWKVKVEQNSSKVVEASFWVKEYVPAKFEVDIHPPKIILPDSTNLVWEICAKYFYGEIVQGDAHIELKLEGTRTADQPSINKSVKLNSYTGCVSVPVQSSDLGLADSLIHPSAIHITATVTEKGTGAIHSASARTPVQNQPFALKFQCSNYFKPGLPYKGNVIMQTMDGRPRLEVGEKIQICIKVRYRGQLAMKLLHCWNYTTDFSSHVVFSLPDIEDSHNIQLITLITTATNYPTKLYPGSGEVMMLQPSVTHYVKPWFSPSRSYLDVWTRVTLPCNSEHSTPVYYTVPTADTPTPTFYYLLEARGDLLKLGSVVPRDESVLHSNEVRDSRTNLVRSWKLALPITPEMSPQSRLTVYYVRSDGEVVAASTTLEVEQCFQNKVRVRWDERPLTPKEPARLCIRASPHSICSISVINRQLTSNISQSATSSDKIWDLLNRFGLNKTPRDQQLYCIKKNNKEEELPPISKNNKEEELRPTSETKKEEESPPTYDLRKKRSILMPPVDYSDHVDAITAFDDLGVMVITNLVLETRPCSRPLQSQDVYRSGWSNPQNFLFDRSLVVPSNMVLVEHEELPNEYSFQSLIRDYFPDTWIWSLELIGKEGEVTLTRSAPDTITSWDTQVVCISEKEGLGVAVPTTVSVFVPFFVHVESPYSIKRGENVTVKVIVYNYLRHPLSIELRFPNNKNVHIGGKQVVKFCLNEISAHSYDLPIIPQAVGKLNLTVQAQTEPMISCGPLDIPSKSDTVITQLLIKNEGFIQQKSQSALICPAEDADSSLRWNLTLPEADNLVEGSAYLQFSVVADMFGPVLENLDQLVLLPMGCGEQNLAKLAPNLFLLKYINALGYEDAQIKSNALKNIKKGYQRQLTFQRSDGSFSAFGDKDDSGSMWLTAAVLRTLSEAKGVIEVDQEALQNSIAWITRQQLENGCFPAVGQVFHKENEIDVSEDAATAALSAFVIASISSGKLSLPSPLTTNAEFCLTAAISSTDPHTLALTSLALVRLGKRQKAIEAVQNLMRLAIIQNDLIHWGKPGSPKTYNIMTTSYAVLSLVELGGPDNILTARKGVRWISTHRNENGGFISTQDTVVALEALTAFALALPPQNRTELMVFVKGGQISRTFRLSNDNKLVQQQLTTNKIPPILSVAIVGEGCAFIQSVLKYNVRHNEVGSQLLLQVSSAAVSTVDPCSMQQLRLCASASSLSTVAMALVTVMLVTGYHPDTNQISHPHIKKWEEEDDQIVFYLSEVNNLPICFTLLLVRKFQVEDPLPAPVSLTDYYHPETATSKSYSIKCSPIAPLDNPVMLADDPYEQSDDRFNNFHNVDFELETPSGVEGPQPVYIKPLNSTVSKYSQFTNYT